MNKILKSTFVFFLLGVVTINCHRWHQKSPEKKAEMIAEKLISKLDLDESQSKTVEKIKNEWIAKHKELKPEGNLKEDFLTLIRAEKLDDEKLGKLYDKMENKRKEMHQFTLVKFKEFHAILNKDQKEKLAEHLDKIMKRFGHEF